MQERINLIKKINKLIIGKIIEINVVVILVIISIPIWNKFSLLIGDANIIKKDDYSLIYKEKTQNSMDFLTIENNYALNKNYKIYLETKKEIETNTEIIINNKSYTLNDFFYEYKDSNKKYTLVNKNIIRAIDTYNIIIKSKMNKIDYNYIFEENNNF